MVYEDYTTYTEVDPNSHIGVLTNHLDFHAYQNEDAYVYKDKGAGHFTDFEHLLYAKVVAAPTATVTGAVWAVSNTVDDTNALWAAYAQAIAVDMEFRDPDRHSIRLLGFENHVADTWTSAVAGTTYYLTIKKSGTAITCKIYSDSARTNLLDTLTITITDRSFRYIFGCCTNNTGTTANAEYDIDNLDLQEAPPVPEPALTKMTLTLTL